MMLRSLVMALEFLALATISLTYVVVIGEASGASYSEQGNLLGMSLMTIAIGTAAMSFRAKMFLPLFPTSIFFTLSLDAAKEGGLALLFTMIFLVGIFQGLIGLAIGRLKGLLSPDLAFLIVALLGFMVAGEGIQRFFAAFEGTSSGLEIGIGFGTLALIFILRAVKNETIKRLAIIEALITGYLVIWACGLFSPSHLHTIRQAPWLCLPFYWKGVSFSWHLVIPCLVVATVSSIMSLGGVSAIQEAKDPNWPGPDMKTVSRACQAGSFGTLFGGIFGGLGLTISPIGLALATSTRTFDKRMGYLLALLCVIVAILCKLNALFIFTPHLVVAAVLIYFGGVLLLNALMQLTTSFEHPSDSYILYLPLLIGLAMQVFPTQVATAAEASHLTYGSNYAYVLVIACILKLIKRAKIFSPYA